MVKQLDLLPGTKIKESAAEVVITKYSFIRSIILLFDKYLANIYYT